MEAGEMNRILMAWVAGSTLILGNARGDEPLLAEGQACPGRVAAEPKVDSPLLPEDARTLVAVFEADARARRETLDREIHAERRRLIVALQTLQDAYTRAARLDEAVAVRDTIRTLKAAHLRVLPNPGTLSKYANCVGQSFHFDVVGRTGGSIWGTEVYTHDSDLATAAVHLGLLKPGQRGILQVTIVATENPHPGSTHNGVTSSSWGTFGASYTLAWPVLD